MKRLIFCITFLFLAAYGQAQFRLAANGTPSWTSLGGGQYQATVTFHADLSGNSYAVAGIVDTMRLFTSRGQVFEVDSVWGKTFSQATLRVEYLEGVSSAPVGQSMVYETRGSVFLPDIAFGSTGATAQLNQAIVSYNSTKSGILNDFAVDDNSIVVSYDRSGNEISRDTIAGTGGINASTIRVTQASHGFNLAASPWSNYGFIPVYTDASGVVRLAQADSISTLATGFIVGISGDVLTIQQSGYISLPGGTTLQAGQYYWLSSTQAGYITAVEPDTSQVVLFVEKGATQAKLIDQRVVDNSVQWINTVSEIADLSDTTSITNSIPGDVFVNVGGDTLGFWNGTYWNIFVGGGGSAVPGDTIPVVFTGNHTNLALDGVANRIFDLDLSNFSGGAISFDTLRNGEYYTIRYYNNNSYDTLSFPGTLIGISQDSMGLISPFTSKQGLINFYAADSLQYVLHSIPPYTLSSFPPVAYDPDYQALLDYATSISMTLPADSTQDAGNQLIIDLKAAGVWSKLDALYMFKTDGCERFARVDWVTLDTLTKSGTVTFTSKNGYKGGGANVTDYLATTWLPSEGPNWGQNSGFAAIWSAENASKAFEMGSSSSDNGRPTLWLNNAGSFWARMSSTTGGNVYSHGGTYIGNWIISRTTSTNIDVHFNGSHVASVSNTSNTAPNSSFFQRIFFHNNEASTARLWYAAWGGGLTPAEAAAMHTAIAAYMNTL